MQLLCPLVSSRLVLPSRLWTKCSIKGINLSLTSELRTSSSRKIPESSIRGELRRDSQLSSKRLWHQTRKTQLLRSNGQSSNNMKNANHFQRQLENKKTPSSKSLLLKTNLSMNFGRSLRKKMISTVKHLKTNQVISRFL